MRLESLLIAILGLILLSSAAFAADITVTPSGEAWIEEVVTVTSSCDSGSNVYGKFSGPMIANLPPFSYDQDWTASFYPSLLLNTIEGGKYKINVTCENGGLNTYTEGITLYSLSLEPVSPQKNDLKVTYPGEDLKVTLNFSRDNTPINNADFKLKLGNTVIFNSKSGDIPVFNSQTNMWEISARIPEYASMGTYDLTIEGSYKDHTMTEVIYNAIEVRSAAEVRIVEPLSLYPYRLSESRDVPLTLTVNYKSQHISRMDVRGFIAKLGDQELLIKEIKYSPSNWSLLVNVPEFTPRKEVYDLNIYVDYKGNLVKSQNSLPIQFLTKFEGFLIDASGTPISGAEMKLKGKGIEETSITDEAGNYSMTMTPGTYDLELNLPELRAKIIGINLSSGDSFMGPVYDPIRYDYSSNNQVDGLTVAKMVALELGMEFDHAYMELPYSDSKVMNEEEISLLACHDWNFGRRTCLGEWEELDIEINTVRNIVIFTAERLSGFVVTEPESLVLEASFDKDIYKPGERMSITGRVIDSSGKEVGGVNIEYELEKTSENGSATTDDSGSFNIDLNAPDDIGEFKVGIDIEKAPYTSTQTTLSREVKRTRGLEISVADYFELPLDQSKTLTFKVMNTGGVDLYDVILSLEGIDSQWYSLNKDQIGQLLEGERMDVTLNFEIPDGYCEEYDCKSEYTVNIRADGQQTSASQALTLNLPYMEDQPTGTGGFFAFDMANVALVVALLAVIALIELKRRGKLSGKFRYKFRPPQKNESRVLLVSSLNKIKSEIVGKRN